jgi:hypothetical protein
VSALAELFPSGDFRFHLTLRRQEPEGFFRPHDPSGEVIAERRRWLAAEPGRYAALLPDGIPVFEEFSALAAEWAPPVPGIPGWDAIHHAGARWEPDILFLRADAAGQFRLQGGALCFPTGWALEEKLGHTLDFIHGPVPGLNAAIGGPIQQFLGRMKPGGAFFRDNWGIAASDELNLHPARRLAAPTLPVDMERLWLRVEHQVLLALPQSGGIVFGIRIARHRLDAVARDPAAAGLRQALETMPAAVAAYKRLEAIRAELIRRL